MPSNRGFVTIAAGQDKYYELARNLLLSYRYFARKPIPFAIICDRTNAVTDMFDEVIMVDDLSCSWLDKLRLPELAPFRETIFVDSDCLAYRDLNGLWRYFEKGPDFGVFGKSYPFESGKGWFTREDAGPFRDNVKFSLYYQGGIIFLRKDGLKDFSALCSYIKDHYGDFSFSGYDHKVLIDDTVFALALSVSGWSPVKDFVDVFCYYPIYNPDMVKVDILSGKLRYHRKGTLWRPDGRFLVHWSTARTDSEVYVREASAINDAFSGRTGFSGASLEARNRVVDFWYHVVETFRVVTRLFTSPSMRGRFLHLFR